MLVVFHRNAADRERKRARLDKRIDTIVSEVLNEADAIIAASRATFNEVDKIVHDADKVHLIPNGVDLKRFSPDVDGSHLRKKRGLKGRNIVFALRHHEPVYGLEYALIRAIPIVAKEKDDVVFVIGGDGSLRKLRACVFLKWSKMVLIPVCPVILCSRRTKSPKRSRTDTKPRAVPTS